MPTIHGQSGRNRTPTYISWEHMMQRCRDTENPVYGGKGITVAPVWHDYETFLRDMGERPEGTTLDRRDSTGNYEPGNCRWSGRLEQAVNRSSTIFVEIEGETLWLAEAGRKYGINETTIRNRYKRGDRGSRLVRPTCEIHRKRESK